MNYIPVKMVAMFNRFAALENRQLQEHLKHHGKPLKLDSKISKHKIIERLANFFIQVFIHGENR